MIIVGTCDYAVRSGKLSAHRLANIELAATGTKKHRAGFVFPTYEQVKIVADGTDNTDKRLSLDGAGICVWLMRGCGLRIEEALAVEKSSFIEDGAVLRVMWQASRDGRSRTPLKHRKPGEYRDVPVPSWLWDTVEDAPDGPLMTNLYWPGRYWSYFFYPDAGGGFSFDGPTALDYDSRSVMYHPGTYYPRKLVERPPTVYLCAMADSEGRRLVGGATYRLRVRRTPCPTLNW